MRLTPFVVLPFLSTAAAQQCFGALSSQSKDKAVAEALQKVDRAKMTAQESNNCMEALIMNNQFDSANVLLQKFYADATEDEL